MATEALNRLADAAEKIARLEPRLREARRDLHKAIREAHAQGASVTVIAKVASLSRQVRGRTGKPSLNRR